MGFVQVEGHTQGTLFPISLEGSIPDDHVYRVIDTFVGRLHMAGLGFERSEAAETGRPGYDPRDLLKLFLQRYSQQIRSSRRLESECRRNIELMWLPGGWRRTTRRLPQEWGRPQIQTYLKGGAPGSIPCESGCRSPQPEEDATENHLVHLEWRRMYKSMPI